VSVLVDSSVWISYFRGSGRVDSVDFLIEENLVVTNDLILAELTPALRMHRQNRLIALLHRIRRYPIQIDWAHITEMQVTCMHNGVNGVGIPDLIIAQNAMQNDLHLFSLDKHFDLMGKHMSLSVYDK